MMVFIRRSCEQGAGHLVGRAPRYGSDLQRGLVHTWDRTRIFVVTAQLYSHLTIVAPGVSPQIRIMCSPTRSSAVCPFVCQRGLPTVTRINTASSSDRTKLASVFVESALVEMTVAALWLACRDVIIFQDGCCRQDSRWPPTSGFWSQDFGFCLASALLPLFGHVGGVSALS